MADTVRKFVCLAYNSSKTCFDYSYEKDTGVWTYQARSGMADGAALTGLGAYYRWVDQNTTVKQQMTSVFQFYYTTTHGQHNPQFFIATNAEIGGYLDGGITMGCYALNNDTWAELISAPENMMAHTNLTGGQIYEQQVGLSLHDYNRKVCNWGGSQNTLIDIEQYLNDTSGGNSAEILKSIENWLFDWAENTPDWSHTYLGVPRYSYGGDTGDYSDLAAAYNFWYAVYYIYVSQVAKPDVWIGASEEWISNVVPSTNTFTFTVGDDSSTGTSKTTVHCGSKGEPTAVSGASSWSYNSNTKICTITVTHSSSQTVTLDWSIPTTYWNPSVTIIWGIVPIIFIVGTSLSFIVYKRKDKTIVLDIVTVSIAFLLFAILIPIILDLGWYG